jgi:hypothetical protein
MKASLLDVNVLIALADRDHIFHAPAAAWFKANHRSGWATCPITENGCLRVMSNPGYTYQGLTAERVRSLLWELGRMEGHRFWPDSISLLEANRFELSGVSPKQLTDLYLLGLAVKYDGRLVTFDRGIRWQAVTEFEPEHLEVI